MTTYFTLLTPTGLAKIANAQLTQNTVAINQVAVGDSNGVNYTPTGNETGLKRERWRGGVASVNIDATNPNWIVVEAVIPSSVGGFTLREVALYDVDGDMIAIGNYPDTYKPLASDGSTMDLVLRTIIEVSNASSITLRIDPNVIVASRKYVDDKVGQVQTALTEHSGQIATTEKLGHIKVDGTTITVDPTTGVASAQGGAIFMEASSDDGVTYTATSDKVTELVDGLQVVVKPTFTSTDTRVTLYLNINGLGAKRIIHSDGTFARPVLFVANYPRTLVYNGYMFVLQDTALLDSLISTSTIAAASANSVKQVNDKFSPENYVVAVLTSGTQDADNPISYFKDSFGVVHVSGVAKTTGTSLSFQMPIGYRPVIETSIPALRTTTLSIVNLVLQKNGFFVASNLTSGNTYAFNFSYRAGA